jgi:hypothetical protein
MDSAVYRLLALGALIIAAAGVFGWMQADTEANLAATRGGEPPPAAAPPPSTVVADLAILTQRRPWGASAAGAAPAAQAAAAQPEAPTGNWRVTGIMSSGPERHVILLVQPQPNARPILRYLPVGDRLPDGRTIERITGDTVHLRRGDQVSVLRLYSPGQG